MLLGKLAPRESSTGPPSATAQGHCHSRDRYVLQARDTTAASTRLPAEASSSSGQECPARPRLSFHSSSLVCPLCWHLGLFLCCLPQPAGPSPQRAGSVPGASRRAWHWPAVLTLPPWGFPTGVRLLQGHVVPPGQHRRLQLGGLWGLQQHAAVPQPAPEQGAGGRPAPHPVEPAPGQRGGRRGVRRTGHARGPHQDPPADANTAVSGK